MSPVDVLQAILKRSDTSELEAAGTNKEKGPVLRITFEIEDDDTDDDEVGL